ncbi:MAG TPA: hypothetical protein VJ951_16575, partial [Bacteroidales bacterium]|nr:hypothetical protein [Bacteroidales bacterium]
MALYFLLYPDNMGVDFRYIDVPKALKRIEQELEKAISEVYFNHLLSKNGRLGTGGMSFDGDPKNIDWDMVLCGAITITGGTLMMIGGGLALTTGVGAPAGGVALTFGAPTFGFGLAK